jgi:hypothetical protein
MVISHPLASFSAILELVGIKDLAEDDPDKFLSATSSFRDVVNQVFWDVSDASVYLFREYCYIQCNSIFQLLDHISHVRNRLLKEYVCFCRGAVVAGSIDAKYVSYPSNENPIIREIEFSSTASLLYGVQERVKGIGISVNKMLAEEKDIKNKCSSTYYVSNSTRKRNFTQFHDILLDNIFMTDANLHRILRSLRRSNTVSRRFSSYYVPLLILWAQCTSLSTKGMEDELDELICKGDLNGLTKIPGLELIYLCFLNKVFSVSLTDTVSAEEEIRIASLKAFFKNSRWLHEVVATDNFSYGIPKEILSRSAKIRFAEFLHE